MPWRDRSGAFSPLRAVVLAAMSAPALSLAWDAWAGALGPKPYAEAIQRSGETAIWVLLATLLVTPARQVLRQARLATIRRMVGLGALAWAAGHLFLYVVDQGSLWRAASEIVLRIYLTLGFAALLALAALGATSTDAAVKRMGGRAWRRLHVLVYALAVLAVVHETLQAKTDVSQAMVHAGLLLWLLAYRVVAPEGGAPGRIAMLVLALACGAATAAGEALWYGLATGISGWRLLEANLDPMLAPRPALWVLGAGLVVAAARALPKPRARKSQPVAAGMSSTRA